MFIFIAILMSMLLQSVLSTPTSLSLEGDEKPQYTRQCVKIKDCDIYTWLIDKGKYGVIGFPKEKVDALLLKDECGLTDSGDVEKVNCPIDSSNEKIDLAYEDNELVDLGERTVSATAGVEDCNGDDVVGSITILHASPEDITKSGKIFLPLRTQLDQKDFPNLKKRHDVLKTNSIIHLEASGNCFCWMFYDEKHFKGDKQLIWPGYRNKLEVRPGSVQKISCPDDYENYEDY